VRDGDPALLTEISQCSFAITDLALHLLWRRRGYAHTLRGALLRNRPKERVTLLAVCCRATLLLKRHSAIIYLPTVA